MNAFIMSLILITGAQVVAAEAQLGRMELKCESGQTIEGEKQVGSSRTIECTTHNGKLDICQMVTISYGPQKGVRMTLLEPKEKKYHIRVFTAGSTLVFLNTTEMTATIVQKAGMYQFCR